MRFVDAELCHLIETPHHHLTGNLLLAPRLLDLKTQNSDGLRLASLRIAGAGFDRQTALFIILPAQQQARGLV